MPVSCKRIVKFHHFKLNNHTHLFDYLEGQPSSHVNENVFDIPWISNSTHCIKAKSIFLVVFILYFVTKALKKFAATLWKHYILIDSDGNTNGRQC